MGVVLKKGERTWQRPTWLIVVKPGLLLYRVSAPRSIARDHLSIYIERFCLFPF